MYKIARLLIMFFGLVFILFAVFNLNDHDWYIWILIYLYVSILCVVAFFRKTSPLLNIFSLMAYLIGGIYLWPESYKGVVMPMEYAVEIELAREALGLFICCIALVLTLYLKWHELKYIRNKNSDTLKEVLS